MSEYLIKNTTNNDTILELDDDKDNSSIKQAKTLYRFLNFSRKVTEASLMKRPVDIQLGIAFGKDPVLNPTALLQKKQRLGYLSNERPPITHNDVSTANTTKDNITNTTSKSNTQTLFTLKLTYSKSTPIISIHRPYHFHHLYHPRSSCHHQQQQQVPSSSPSPFLSCLVADVLKHIESCPGHSAYSYDLDRLKPKLQEYSTAN